jgi:hypothetical protein
MQIRYKNIIYTLIVGILIMLSLSSCGISKTISKDETNKFISTLQAEISDLDYIFLYYIIDEKSQKTNRTVQSVKGLKEYIEHTAISTKYYKDGNAIKIVNGISQYDSEFKLELFDDEAKVVFKNAKLLLLDDLGINYVGQTWKGIFPDRSIIYRELSNEEITLLSLDEIYITADISILFNNDSFMYFTITAYSDNKSDSIKYIWGNIDYRLVLDFPK